MSVASRSGLSGRKNPLACDNQRDRRQDERGRRRRARTEALEVGGTMPVSLR